MTYIEIYKKLSGVKITENTEMTFLQRARLTFRIAQCSKTIQEEIVKYLDTQDQPEYSITLTFTDKKTNRPKTTVVSCQDIIQKMHLTPLPALLYMDWLRREPEQAALFVIRKDDLKILPKEEIRAHIDPSLLAKADKKRQEKEFNDQVKLENGK